MLSPPVLNSFMVKATASGHILPGWHSGLTMTRPTLQTWADSARSQAVSSPSCSQLRSGSVGDLDSRSLCSWVAQVTSDPVSSSVYLNDWPLKPQNESNSPRGIPQTASGFAGGCESSSHLHDQSWHLLAGTATNSCKSPAHETVGSRE